MNLEEFFLSKTVLSVDGQPWVAIEASTRDGLAQIRFATWREKIRQAPASLYGNYVGHVKEPYTEVAYRTVNVQEADSVDTNLLTRLIREAKETTVR